MALILSHEEQEQVDALKAWWRENRLFLIGAVGAALLFSVAWHGWQWWRGAQEQRAAQAFALLEEALDANAWEKASEAWRQLKAVPWVGERQALYAAILVADRAAKAEAWERALPVVTEALSLTGEPEAQILLQLNAAAMLLAQGKADEAARLLPGSVSAPFTPLLDERKGDVALAQNRSDEALRHFDAALAAVGDPAAQRLLRAKREVSAALANANKEKTP